jgi:hypothetical protein
MGNAKIEFSFGAVSFSGEGEEAWLSQQLERVITEAREIYKQQPPTPQDPAPVPKTHTGQFRETLAAYIKAKGGDDNQVQRFLATADWLRRRGTAKLTTAAVVKALKDNQQKRLGNPADCLNQNVGKGHCEKTDDGFFITPEGLTSLGHTG